MEIEHMQHKVLHNIVDMYRLCHSVLSSEMDSQRVRILIAKGQRHRMPRNLSI